MMIPQTIYAGVTPLASTLALAQTGPMQVTVRAGRFTTTGDVRAQLAATTVVLGADVSFSLTSDPTSDKFYLLELGLLNGAPDVLCRSQFAGEAQPAAPAGWQTVHWLAMLTVPAGAAVLDAVPITVFTVLPGFPIGTTAADWRLQVGVHDAAY